MILAVNIGNTTVTCGIFGENQFVTSWKIPTHSEKALFTQQTISFENIKGVVVGSVVPQKTPQVLQELKTHKLPAPIVVTGDMPLPISLAIDNPRQVGADIIADLAAGKRLNKTGVIIVDSGTATTFNILSKENKFLGTVIAPGMESMAKSLTDQTALLPSITLEKPAHILGTNTIACMQSGVYFGYAGLVNEIVARLKKEFPKAAVVATGGNIQKVAADIQGIDTINDYLTLEGLYAIYTYQDTGN